MEFASNGKANVALTTGIIGTSLGAIASGILGGNGGGLFGGGCVAPENMPVNRYELDLIRENDSLKTQVALRDSNTYTDQKILELYRYVDGKLDGVNAQLCAQAVVNAQVTANLSCLQGQVAALNALTKTVIPIGNVCPEPMPAYNSWTAPTATA